MSWILNDESIYSDNQVVKFIESGDAKIVFLDGPSMCGKTALIKRVDCAKNVIIAAERIAETTLKYLEEGYISDEIKNAEIVFFEDIDISLSGRPVTQEVFCDFIVKIARQKTVVLTGISLRERLQVIFLQNPLGATGYGFFEYRNN